MPDAFNDRANVTRSHMPVANTPVMIDVPHIHQQLAWEGRTIPEGGEATPSTQQGTLVASQSPAPTLKRGKPLGSKDSQPRKRKMAPTSDCSLNPTIAHSSVPRHEVILDYGDASDETCRPLENREILVHCTVLDEVWNRNEMIVEDAFSYSVTTDIMLSDDIKPRSVDECRHRTDWSNWKQAIQVELDSLVKRKVFVPIVPTPPHVKPIGYKWVFLRKCNEKNEIVRYKARLVTQGVSQCPEIDYEETYSPVMDIITFCYLINLLVSKNTKYAAYGVVTAYLYGDLDTEIYMKVPEGLPLTGLNSSKPQNTLSIGLRRSLYGLKQSERMWYNRLSEYLTSQGYVNNELCPCVFIKKSHYGFAIIAIYVDGINLIGIPAELEKIVAHLKSEFKMKYFGKTRYCLNPEIEHCSDGILVHQSNYTQKVLRHFNEDKAKPSSTPMVIQTLDAKQDPFHPKEDEEEILEPKVPYLSAIGALLYLAKCTRPDISFAMNLLARYSNAPTRRHWTGVKDIFRYLKCTADLGLFYTRESPSVAVPYGTRIDSRLIGYANARYLFDPHRACSQTGYVFTVGDTAISWRSTNQTLVVTSSNHAEILTLHEASHECFWLREVMGHIRSTSGLIS
ncbi:hypothetical protein TB1_019085 [Malus domestica]